MKVMMKEIINFRSSLNGELPTVRFTQTDRQKSEHYWYVRKSGQLRIDDR